MFSYGQYLHYVKPFVPILSGYKEALSLDEFAILRHDVEFDPIRALELARVENENNLKSVYFFQVCSDAYNLFSIANRQIMKEILSLGHEIGLHLYVSHQHVYSRGDFEAELDVQAEMLSSVVASDISIFSVHRPKNWFLELRQDFFGSFINAYGPSFFEFNSSPKLIKYFADSTHEWKYGEPKLSESFKKYQILVHPDEWFSFDNTAYENYVLTYKAHCERFGRTLVDENKRFHTFGILTCESPFLETKARPKN